MRFDVFDFNDLVSFAREIGAAEIPDKYCEFTPEEIAHIEKGEVFADFVAYIRDRQQNGQWTIDYRFHLCNCRTITDFIERGIYDVKYWKCNVKKVKINNIRNRYTYTWPVHFTNTYTDGQAKMEVCRNCLWELDYNGYRNATKRERDKIAKEFDIIGFYERYGTMLPLRKGIPDFMFNEYARNWPEISRRIRKNANYKCENCGKDCSQNHSYLHVHHVNLNKSDNRGPNLRVLCRDCHAREHRRDRH